MGTSFSPMMTSNVFEDYSAYYDLLYHDKDYAKEADYVAQTLRAADPSVSDLLEFGSGTGRHGRLLEERGLRVLGVERSKSMVAAARTRHHFFKPVQEASNACRATSAPCNWIVSSMLSLRFST